VRASDARPASDDGVGTVDARLAVVIPDSTGAGGTANPSRLTTDAAAPGPDAIAQRALDSAARHDGAADRAPVAPVAPAVVEAPVGPPGKIRVRAYPTDAEILVDGRLLGRGAVVDSAVASGARHLRIVAPGYRTLDTTITVPAGETAQLGTLRLVPTEVTP